MVHAEVATLASAAPGQDGSSGVVIYLYVADVDAIVERAKAAGARVLLEPRTQVWGDYVGRLLDPSGHVWNVAQRDDVRAVRVTTGLEEAT
jgi:PhnB protein